MPYKPKHPCAYPGCPKLAPAGEMYCKEHKKKYNKVIDKRRGTATQRGYNYRWRKVRKIYLAQHPLCVMCLREGNLTPATVVDHIRPHKGNYDLFWDKNNWQALCERCHKIKTAKEDGAFGNRIK